MTSNCLSLHKQDLLMFEHKLKFNKNNYEHPLSRPTNSKKQVLLNFCYLTNLVGRRPFKNNFEEDLTFLKTALSSHF